MKKIQKGFEISSDEQFFNESLSAVVDYRGDVTIDLVDQPSIEGYVFSADTHSVQIFPKDGSNSRSIDLKNIKKVIISGDDTSAGKSWEDWMRRRDAERSKSQKSRA